MSYSKVTTVQGNELFRGLPNDAVLEILDGALTRQFSPGIKFVTEGAHSDSVHIILKGRIKLTTGDNGCSIILKLAQAGEVIGDASVLSSMPSPFTASATGRGESLFWPAKTFERFARNFPQIGSNSMGLAVNRERQLLRRLCALLTDTVERRIARSLAELGEGPSGSPALLYATGQDIADLSDASLYTVSRVLSRWKRDGILRGGRGYIGILDANRLSHIIETSA